MSNIDDIDYTLNLLNQKRITDRKIEETIKGTEEAITRLERAEANPYLGWYGPDGKPLTKEQYRKMMDMVHKSTIKSEIPTTKATFINKTIKFINKNKADIAGILATALLVITTLGATLGPALKINKQKEDLSKNLGEHFTQLKYCEQTDGLFKKFKLTISPRIFVNKLNLTADSDMRLYILSIVLRQEDFDNILWELGFNNQEDYLRRLGFEHGELRAGEQYSNEYDKKLNNIIKTINENPDKATKYFDECPELRFIVDSDNTIMIDGEIITTRNHGGRR